MAVGVVSTGDLKTEYSVIGVVGAHVDNTDSEPSAEGCGGCGGPTNTRVYVTISATYERGRQALLEKAIASGGNAVIFARFEHRIALETLADPAGAVGKLFGQKGSDTKTSQVTELFCYGTAVKVHADANYVPAG